MLKPGMVSLTVQDNFQISACMREEGMHAHGNTRSPINRKITHLLSRQLSFRFKESFKNVS